LLVFKLDGLQKHVGCHKTTFAWPGDGYWWILHGSSRQNAKNKWQYTTFHGQVSMAQQITNRDLIESKR
jgi:hypothetical protein